MHLLVVVVASTRVKAENYIFLGSSNRSNTSHNRRDTKSNPSSSTGTTPPSTGRCVCWKLGEFSP